HRRSTSAPRTTAPGTRVQASSATAVRRSGGVGSAPPVREHPAAPASRGQQEKGAAKDLLAWYDATARADVLAVLLGEGRRPFPAELWPSFLNCAGLAAIAILLLANLLTR